MKSFAFTAIFVAIASANFLRETEANDVDLWGQCGGKEYKGDTKCAPGSYCKVFNEWYSQCQPGGDNSVGLWGQCGGNGYNGPTKCAEGSNCKKWSDTYSQCVPNDSPTKIPANYVVSNGVCFDRCDGATDYQTTGINSFEACVNEANTRGKDYARWDGKTCEVYTTVYAYKMNESCKSAARFNTEKWSCEGNQDYYGYDIYNAEIRFTRCLDTCELYTAAGQNCNAITFVQNPGQDWGRCFLKNVSKDAKPVSNNHGGTACKWIK
ncbi:hypothetical protein THRCLA_08877 [Thraustotheca clavata]|uniref:Secreted protein n=1 Tax=Thraustotheca clavata TaxID=74557 RepID=A0A0A7CMH0_9STRA|nr:secreted protein [Thraustotheca clavata]OQR91783.1 hypothetical protein THRCLA_08877 [Thraustotheca clavata]